MKIIKRALIVFTTLVILSIISGFIYSKYIVNKNLPDYNLDIKLKGLSAAVTVYREANGVPHIYAENEHDLYMATGYIVSQDRFWQMDLLRRAASGRLAEILGKDLVETDELMRIAAIGEKSKKTFAASDERTRKNLMAFSAGVNHYIEDNRHSLPFEFTILGYSPEPWEPAHSVSVIEFMSWNLGIAWKTELAYDNILQKVGEKHFKEILPGDFNIITAAKSKKTRDRILQKEGLALMERSAHLTELGLTVLFGSNNWAVSGKKSVTGKPILANDMHLKLYSPGTWYQVHQSVKNGIEVSGLLLPGAPPITAGHNKYIAWGVTNVMVDDMDFFAEKINPANPDEYFYKGKWRKMKIKTEKIRIKGGAVVEQKIRFTAHGPIISKFKKITDRAISMHWAGHYPSNEMMGMFLLNRAKNWDDFKKGAKHFKAININIAYADIAGNIGLYCSVGIPVRKKENKGIGLCPGWTDTHDWKGFVPFEKQPHIYNPESGMVASANNKPIDMPYSYYISQWFVPPYRVGRIREMLLAKEKFSVEDFKVMQNDQKSIMAGGMKTKLVSSLKKMKNPDSIQKKAITMIENWDCILDKESPEAAIFEWFYLSLMENIFKDELGEELYQKFIEIYYIIPQSAIENFWARENSIWFDDVTTSGIKENFDQVVWKSFKDALSKLNEKIGDDPEDWKWGKIHTMTFAHPLGKVKLLDFVFNLNSDSYPVGGSVHTVSPYSYLFVKPFSAYVGACHRHIFDCADWNRSYSILPTGNSGNPGSDFYGNQTEDYINGKYYKDIVDKKMIQKVAHFKMKLHPE
ncbi:MAG: penicillin acylase family protein [bacterium]|nr:penicillin acylase family protein [bacterium]